MRVSTAYTSRCIFTDVPAEVRERGPAGAAGGADHAHGATRVRHD